MRIKRIPCFAAGGENFTRFSAAAGPIFKKSEKFCAAGENFRDVCHFIPKSNDFDDNLGAAANLQNTIFEINTFFFAGRCLERRCENLKINFLE